jgi:hypothetical protein
MAQFKKITVQDDDKAVIVTKPETTGFSGDVPGGAPVNPLVATPVSIRDLKAGPAAPKIEFGLVRSTIMCCW